MNTLHRLMFEPERTQEAFRATLEAAGDSRRIRIAAAYARGAMWRLLKPYTNGAGVIPYQANGRVALVRHTYGPRVWSLAGGGLAGKEAKIELANRHDGIEPDYRNFAKDALREYVAELRPSEAPDQANLSFLTFGYDQSRGNRDQFGIFGLPVNSGIEFDPKYAEIKEVRWFDADGLPVDVSSYAQLGVQALSGNGLIA